MKTHARSARLSIANADFYAYHGVREEERLLGGRYQVDIDVEYDASAAVMSDDLSDTVNYEEILFTVNEHMNGEPYELIETIAFDIATSVIEQFALVQTVTVRVRKLNVPVQQILDYVEAEITAKRDS